MEAIIRKFIGENFYVSDPESLAGDASLLDLGIVDSTGVLELTAFLEAELGIEIADAEIIPSNLDSIERIVAFVERKRATPVPTKTCGPVKAA